MQETFDFLEHKEFEEDQTPDEKFAKWKKEKSEARKRSTRLDEKFGGTI